MWDEIFRQVNFFLVGTITFNVPLAAKREIRLQGGCRRWTTWAELKRLRCETSGGWRPMATHIPPVRNCYPVFGALPIRNTHQSLGLQLRTSRTMRTPYPYAPCQTCVRLGLHLPLCALWSSAPASSAAPAPGTGEGRHQCSSTTCLQVHVQQSPHLGPTRYLASCLSEARGAGLGRARGT